MLPGGQLGVREAGGTPGVGDGGAPSTPGVLGVVGLSTPGEDVEPGVVPPAAGFGVALGGHGVAVPGVFGRVTPPGAEPTHGEAAGPGVTGAGVTGATPGWFCASAGIAALNTRVTKVRLIMPGALQAACRASGASRRAPRRGFPSA